jgi:Glu-tRNA(Gln) amidotransferase subunit E-like FAD-binding protein
MMPTAKQNMLARKWERIHTTKTQMETLLLALMKNPETDAEHLMQAHAMYAKVCEEIADISHHVINALRSSTYVMSSHMRSCPSYKSGDEDDCVCKPS